MDKKIINVIMISLFSIAFAYGAEPYCKVTEKENTVTVHQLTMMYGVEIEKTSMYTLGNTSVDLLDVSEIKIKDAEPIMNLICQEMMKEKGPNDRVLCAPNKIIASSSMLRDPNKNMRDLRKIAKEECDEFFKNLRDSPKKSTEYPITDCNVKVENGKVLTNIIGSSFKVSEMLSPGYHNMVHSREIYTGFSNAKLSYICRQYKNDSHNKNVICNGNEIEYDDGNFDEMGELSLKNIYFFSNVGCKAMLSGDLVMEDFWKIDE